jgi:PAS domain S-box-containing protein
MATEVELPQLLTAVRDLVALSSISAVWVGRDPAAIADGLAELLVGSLRLDFAFVRMCDPGGHATVEATRGSAWREFPEWLRDHPGVVSGFSRKVVVSDVGDGNGRRRGMVIPIGIDAQGGLVAAASDRTDFPAEIDQLLLSVAANHAATAFQNARALTERTRAEEVVRQARDQLELKVLERTAELREAAEERSAHLWFLESLDRVNRAMQGTNDVEQMMSDVLDVVLSILGADRASLIYPCDPSASSMRVVMEHTRPEFPGAFALGLELPVDDEFANVLRLARASGEPVRFGPGSEQPVPPQVAERFSVQSMIAIAVYPKGDAPYLFGLHQCSHARVWTPQEQRLLQEIGRRLTDALTTLLIFRNLRMSEARLADAQRISHVAYWERDLDTDFFTWSEEAYRIFGLAPQERPIPKRTLMERVHPADRPVLERTIEAMFAGGPRYDIEYRVVRPSGEVRIVHSQGHVVRDESGRARRTFGTVQDITERRRAEELTRQIFETMPDTAYVVDQSYRLRRVNAVCAQDWQLPAEVLVGMHLVDLVGPETFARIKPGVDRCLAGEVVSYSGWFDLPRGRRFRSGSLSPLRDSGLDRIDAALIVVRDLTDSVLASEALHEARAELARVTRVTMLGEITASIAHEINQPLAAVVLNGNACRRWLATEPPNLEEARDTAARIVGDAERAGKIIARIRTLARRGDPERQMLDVNDVIREAIEFARSDLDRRRIVVRAELTGGLPPISGDRVQLQQVLVNLLLNAGDAMADMPPGPRTVTMTTRREVGGGVLVEVTDRGKGIDPAHAARLFEPFFSTKSEGLGMGLAISRSIVEAHGGRIWAAANQDACGTTMSFVLPNASSSGGPG